MTQIRQTRNFAMVQEENHRGSGQYKNKNVPSPTGVLTMSVSLGFLYRQSQRLSKEKHSLLLGVINCAPGYDAVKHRLNFYGLFGKKAQSNPQKGDFDDLQQIFVWGQNVTWGQQLKIYNMIAGLERQLGDDNATSKNFKQSPKFDEALKLAETRFVLVTAWYDDGFFDIDEDDETRATLSVAYVQIGAGRAPLLTSFAHDKDDLQEVTFNGKKYNEYEFGEEGGGIAFATSRGYLQNFYSQKDNVQNTKMLTAEKDGKESKFWTAQLKSFTKDDLPGSFYASMPQEIRAKLDKATRINFNYVFKASDDKVLDQILNLDYSEDYPDAHLVFSGLLKPDKYREYTNDAGEYQITFDLSRGTFYTLRLIKPKK